MRATVMYGAGDVCVETVPDPRLIDATDAVVRVTRSAICGSDLWPYQSMPRTETGARSCKDLWKFLPLMGLRSQIRVSPPFD
jgi:threonine dehydrogenase-like Zn-dependent dehydrogenase